MDHHAAALLLAIASDWQNAYQAANGKAAPEVAWENGWFIIDGKRYRRAALIEIIGRLRKVAVTSGMGT